MILYCNMILYYNMIVKLSFLKIFFNKTDNIPRHIFEDGDN